MQTPRDLRYSKEHEWVRLEGETATVGITDFAQDQLGDIVYLNLPAAGIRVEQFGKIGEIESVKSVSELFTPIGGEVIEMNQAAVDQPEIVNQEPYGAGWLIRLRVEDAAQLDNLLSADEYEAHVATEH
jgi:glycine cleavage system H protein